ncbi:primosomal protein N' [Paraphotobacterium marinum]
MKIKNKVVNVALPIPLKQCFQYINCSEKNDIIGYSVSVPFGKRVLKGIVISEVNTPITKNLKTILEVIGSLPYYSQKEIDFFFLIAKYYHYPLGQLISKILPIQVDNQIPIIKEYSLNKDLTNHLNLIPKRAFKQQQIINYLMTNKVYHSNSKQFKKDFPIIKKLIDKNIIVYTKFEHKVEEIKKIDKADIINSTNKVYLNQEQKHAIDSIDHFNLFQVYLLYGITGSGKTEVFLNLIEKVLLNNKKIIYLVPEIGLIPQTKHRIQKRFNCPVYDYHSEIRVSEKKLIINECKTRKPLIIVGTRSTIFLSINDLGMIIIDEEHDSSYKQQDSFRYNARDIGILKAKIYNIPVVLGSATPSLESLNNVKQNKYKLLTLLKRASNLELPRITIYDIKNTFNKSGISDFLLNKIKIHINNNKQVLVFLNKKGFSDSLICNECGWISECERCEKFYTLYMNSKKLKCNYCLHEKPIDIQCLSCGSTQLHPLGFGTEQVQKYLEESFPNKKVIRLDGESTKDKSKFLNTLKDIENKNYDIIIGTQLITKGHHFKHVTLSALVNVDSALFSNDFRAIEKLNQQVIQVSGRAGRESFKSEVIIQTHFPEHSFFSIIKQQNYLDISKNLLKEREIYNLPPFSNHIIYRSKSINSDESYEYLMILKSFINKQNKNILTLGPSPASIRKKAGLYRWLLILQHDKKSELFKVINEVELFISRNNLKNKVKSSIDIDPLEST